MRLVAVVACAAALAAGSAAFAQQIQTGTPRATTADPSATAAGTAQPADTNPSTEQTTGTAGPKAEQARSGAQSVTTDQSSGGRSGSK